MKLRNSKHYDRMLGLLAGSVLTLCAPTLASAAEELPQSTDDATVEAVIVNGQQFKGQATPMRLSTSPASDIAAVTVLSGEDISRQTLTNNIDIFRSIPGVQVGEFGQVGIAQGVSFRGWPGAQDSSSVAFYLDGVQRNEPSGTGSNGYLDINPLIPEILDDVTVVKGPFNTRYGGSFALAGSFIATTRDELNNSLALSAGSYGHYRGLLTLGTSSEKGSIYTAVRAVSDSGYQDNADQKQYTTFTKATVPFAAGEASVSVQTYDLKHGSPGYLDLANIKAGLTNRRDDIEDTDGGKKHQYTVVLNYRQGDAEEGFEAALYGETQSRERFATFTPYPQANTRNRRNFYGLSLDYHRTLPTIAGFDTLVQTGVSVRHDDADTVRQPSVKRIAIETPTPLDAFGYGRANIGETQQGAYLSAVFKRGSWFKLSTGVRYDHAEYDVQYQSYLSASNSFRHQDISRSTGRFTPKLGLAISPTEDIVIFGNYAKSVAPPDAVREVPIVSGSLAMPTLSTQEVGVAWNPIGGRLHLQASYYDTQNSDEFVIINSLVLNQGESKRHGYDLEASALAYDGDRLKVRTYANYSRIHARLNSGQRISAVADWVGSYGLHADYRLANGKDLVLFDLGQQWTGPQALNGPNTFRSDTYSRITSKVSYQIPDKHNLKFWAEGTVYPGSLYDEFGFVISNRVYVTSMARARLNLGVNIDF